MLLPSKVQHQIDVRDRRISKEETIKMATNYLSTEEFLTKNIGLTLVERIARVRRVYPGVK